MTKADLISTMASSAKISKAAAARALDAALDGIKAALKNDERVTLVGFGSFSVSKRQARTGRNPQTGKEIKIAARKVPRFTAGKPFKDAI